MSASPVSENACPSCGTELPPAARFCPACGAAAGAADTTLREPLPPTESERSPATVSRAEPRWFGVAPPTLLLVLGFAALGASIGLFASGRWPYGLILLGVAVLLLGLFLETALHRSDSELARRSMRTWTHGRSRIAATWEVSRARLDAAADERRIRGHLARVTAERGPAAQALGVAVHEGDDQAAEKARAQLAALDERRAELERALAERRLATEERIHGARLTVDRTMMVSPNEPNAPYPPPDEGTPPTPAPVPEPYPPPDEGTPPVPDPGSGSTDDK